jgi:hypothetical protein
VRVGGGEREIEKIKEKKKEEEKKRRKKRFEVKMQQLYM